ncbi:MAG: hypothetical protein M1835_001393 [Candelina submexicana]|nr:MAG: hypothetical protein M1835_001393 [Candelina submexicana]
MHAYNGNGEDFDEDLCHKQPFNMDYEGVEMKTDARSKCLPSANSHSSSFGFDSRSVSVEPEVADGPALTPYSKTETIDGGFDVTTAPSTVTLVSLGLTGYAVKHRIAE